MFSEYYHDHEDYHVNQYQLLIVVSDCSLDCVRILSVEKGKSFENHIVY